MDINREEILKTAARYVVLSLGFWKEPDGEFGYHIGDGIMEVPRDVKQVMAFSWNGLADNVALLIRVDSTDIKAVLTEKPEWLQKAIRKELTEREGVVPSCNHMGKVETNGNVFIQDFFENRAGDFAHVINRIKKFFLNAIAEKILEEYYRFRNESPLGDADFCVVGRFEENASCYTGRIMTWQEIVDGTIDNWRFGISLHEYDYLVKHSMDELVAILVDTLDLPEATISHEKGMLCISPKTSLCSSQMNDYFLDGMK